MHKAKLVTLTRLLQPNIFSECFSAFQTHPSGSKEGKQRPSQTDTDCTQLANRYYFPLEINTKKTKIVYFNKSGKKSNSRFHINGTDVEEVREYKYLGVYVSSTGSFTEAKKQLLNVATKAFYGLKRYVDLNMVTVRTSLHLFDTVNPIMFASH